ncbi:MAG: carbohydrate porin [bacterium]
MRALIRFVRWKGAVSLVVLLAAGLWLPAGAGAQPAISLEKKIEALERQLNSLKKELQAVRSEQRAQKAKAASQAKEIGSIKDLKKSVEELSKISISGGVTGIVEGTSGVKSSQTGDDTFAVGSFDLVFEYKPKDNILFVLDLEGIGGDGPDSLISTLSGLNDDAGSTEDNVTVLEAYIEAVLFQDRFTVTAGKIDMTNYVDGNALAGDETSQFLATAFVNNAVLSAPDNAPGVRGRFDLVPDLLYVEAGVMSQDVDANGRTSDRLFNDVYGAVEVGVTPKLFGRQGAYRVWGFLDGAGREVRRSGKVEDFTASGGGVSFDQEIADWLGVFFRFGARDSSNLNYNTNSAWSAGAELSGFIPGRGNDALGGAYGEVKPAKRDSGLTSVSNERLFEIYYRYNFAEDFHLTAFVQNVTNRLGNSRADDITAFGLRLQLNF